MQCRLCEAALEAHDGANVAVEQGLRVRRPGTLHRWLRAYASATATTAHYSAIVDAATQGEGDKPSAATTIAYRDVLAKLWMLDPEPA